MNDNPEAAYVHVPFCVHRCGYCDFTVVAGRDDLIGRYLPALGKELQSLGRPCVVETLYVGGGTPTQLRPKELAELTSLLGRWFRLRAAGEFSVEANPAGLTAAKVAVLAEAGVNRVSLGAQSFDPEVLVMLERDHGPRDIVAAVEQVRRRIENVSLDLIFGVPGQSLDSWRRTLAAAVQLHPQHVSAYGLTYEKGTTFWNRRQAGRLKPAEDALEADMYGLAMDMLAAAGFEQYEISSFARPGFRCRHNETYWDGRPYYGFGPGAARYLGGRRETNHRSVYTWLKRIESGAAPVADSEALPPEASARELAALRLRTAEGADKAGFRIRTGYDILRLGGRAIPRHIELGLLEDTGTHLRLTRAGRFLADTVVGDLLQD